MKIETMGEMHTDDVSGVHMASGETINIKNNPDGVKDQMLKEEHSYCHGAMCQTFVEETGASDTIVNMDGSLTCKEEECVTNYEAVEKDSIDRNQALSPCLPQICGFEFSLDPCLAAWSHHATSTNYTGWDVVQGL